MTGLATYALIVLFNYSTGSAMTTTPMATQQLCFEAAAEAKKLEGTLSTIKAICVRTS